MLNMKVVGCTRRGKAKKIWIDCVRIEMCIKSVHTEMIADRVEWHKKTCRASPT